MKEPEAQPERPALVVGVEAGLDRTWAYLSRPWPAVMGVYVVLLALVTRAMKADIDLFHRLAMGRLVEANGGVLHQDPFAFSPRLDAWIDHEWLSGVVFYEISRVGGGQALLYFSLLLMFFTVALIVGAHRKRLGEKEVQLPWLLVTLPLLWVVWIGVIRCRTFTFLFVAILFAILMRWRQGDRKWLWLVPPLFGVWMNLHGGVVAGMGLWGLAALAASLEDFKKSIPLWLALMAALPLTLVNPYGIDLWVYLAEAAVMDRPGIGEWQSPPVGSALWIIPVALVASAVMGGVLSRRKEPLETWLLIGVCLVATLWSQRIVTFLVVVLAVFGGPPIRALGLRLQAMAPLYWKAGRRVATLLLLVLFGYSGWLSSISLRGASRSGLNMGDLPVEAVEWLDQEGGGGKLLVDFFHGGFALWRLYPAYRVSVDARYEEVYPQSTVDLNQEAMSPTHPNHREALAALDPDYILLSVPWQDTAAFPEDWVTVFDNGTSKVLARNHTPPGELRPRRSLWEPAF